MEQGYYWVIESEGMSPDIAKYSLLSTGEPMWDYFYEEGWGTVHDPYLIGDFVCALGPPTYSGSEKWWQVPTSEQSVYSALSSEQPDKPENTDTQDGPAVDLPR